MAIDFRTPGVYREELASPAAQVLRTGVPAFLGFTGDPTRARAWRDEPHPPLTLWPQFAEKFGPPLAGSYLPMPSAASSRTAASCATSCGSTPARPDGPEEALAEGLRCCAADRSTWSARPTSCGQARPCPTRPPSCACRMRCSTTATPWGIALRSSMPGRSPGTQWPAIRSRARSPRQRGCAGTTARSTIPGSSCRRPPAAAGQDAVVAAPPCGHVAGVYARSDQRVGVYKAPANEVLEGVLDLADNLTDQQQAR